MGVLSNQQGSVPTGHSVLTASKDKTVRLWDVRIGKRTLGEPLTHESGVNSAEFSLDGRQVLTAQGTKRLGSGMRRAASPWANP